MIDLKDRFSVLITCANETIGNGYIEGEELDNFLMEICSNVNTTEISSQVKQINHYSYFYLCLKAYVLKFYFLLKLIPKTVLSEFREAFLDAYDANGDGTSLTRLRVF